MLISSTQGSSKNLLALTSADKKKIPDGVVFPKIHFAVKKGSSLGWPIRQLGLLCYIMTFLFKRTLQRLYDVISNADVIIFLFNLPVLVSFVVFYKDKFTGKYSDRPAEVTPLLGIVAMLLLVAFFGTVVRFSRKLFCGRSRQNMQFDGIDNADCIISLFQLLTLIRLSSFPEGSEVKIEDLSAIARMSLVAFLCSLVRVFRKLCSCNNII